MSEHVVFRCDRCSRSEWHSRLDPSSPTGWLSVGHDAHVCPGCVTGEERALASTLTPREFQIFLDIRRRLKERRAPGSLS